MCIIVFDNRDSTERLDKEVLERCMERNSDGMGIMYPDGKGGLSTWRSMKDFNGIWSRYCTARNHNLPVAVHFRITTKGGNSLENCHPFKVNDQLSMMHNGTISGMGIIPNGTSDTRHFRNTILKQLPDGFLKSQSISTLLQSFISGDRMLFMDDKGGFSILNEDIGSWELSDKADERNGVWFSHTRDNGYYLTGKKTTPLSKYGWSNAHYGSWDNTPYTSQQWGSTDQKRSRSVCSLKYASDNDRLLFVYGEWRDDVEMYRDLDPIPNSMASYVNEGTAKDVQLWAINDSDSLINARAGAFKSTGKGFATKGIVLYLRDHKPDAMLAKLDTMMGVSHLATPSLYYRTKIDVSVSGGKFSNDNGTFPMWTYLATVNETLNPLIGVVPHGDWDEWLSRMDSNGDVPPVDESVDTVNIDDLEYSLCGKCYQSGIIPFSTIAVATALDEVDHYWCETCKESYPINITVEIFPS